MKKCGLQLENAKCVFMAYEVTYLGFRINKNEVNSLPEKVADLLNVETCSINVYVKTVHGIRERSKNKCFKK